MKVLIKDKEYFEKKQPFFTYKLKFMLYWNTWIDLEDFIYNKYYLDRGDYYTENEYKLMKLKGIK